MKGCKTGGGHHCRSDEGLYASMSLCDTRRRCIGYIQLEVEAEVCVACDVEGNKYYSVSLKISV